MYMGQTDRDRQRQTERERERETDRRRLVQTAQAVRPILHLTIPEMHHNNVSE